MSWRSPLVTDGSTRLTVRRTFARNGERVAAQPVFFTQCIAYPQEVTDVHD
jgi:hypothetical protein